MLHRHSEQLPEALNSEVLNYDTDGAAAASDVTEENRDVMPKAIDNSPDQGHAGTGK